MVLQSKSVQYEITVKHVTLSIKGQNIVQFHLQRSDTVISWILWGSKSAKTFHLPILSFLEFETSTFSQVTSFCSEGIVRFSDQWDMVVVSRMCVDEVQLAIQIV